MRRNKPKTVRWRVAGAILSLVFLWGVWEGLAWKLPIDVAVDEWRHEQVRLEELKADTYGGATPQETLDLFIEALEKRDFELASKYFVPEEQGQELEILKKADADGRITEIISFVKRFERDDVSSAIDGVTFSLVLETEEYGHIRSRAILIENMNNLWKIKRL